MLRRGRVEVTGGFLLTMAWLNYTDTQGLLPWALLACAAHEGGHWLAIRALGGRIVRLRLSAIGAQMRLERVLSYHGEFLCALAGPAVNLLLALVCARLGGEDGAVFAGMNLALGSFNLLPVSVLDGGRCLFCLTACLFGPTWAQRVRDGADAALSAALLWAGVALLRAGGSVTLLLVAIWLFLRSGSKVGGKGVVKGRRNG